MLQKLRKRIQKHQRRNRLIRRLWRAFGILFLGFVLGSVLLVASLRYLDPPTWAWKLQRQHWPPAAYPAQVKHDWVSTAQISLPMQLAVIAAEDQNFPQHHGFDLDAIGQAIEAGLQGKRLRGASTLSQQTAKNLFLWPGRSLLRKGIEGWFTFWLELLLSKSRILEIYLNIVEFGPGIFGVEAASRQYFGKPAAELSPWESARLAAVLPNPYRFQVNRPTAYVLERSGWIQQQMRQLGTGTIESLR